MLQRKEWLLWHQCYKSLAKSLQLELENVFLIKFIILYVCFTDRHDEHWPYLANNNGIHIHQILCNYDKYVSCCLRLPAFCEQPPREIRSISTDNQKPVAAASGDRIECTDVFGITEGESIIFLGSQEAPQQNPCQSDLRKMCYSTWKSDINIAHLKYSYLGFF